MPTARGHLFISRGDLTRLSCDAVLVPSGSHGGELGHVGNSGWSEALGAARRSDGFVDVDFGERRTAEVRPGSPEAPAVWLGHSGDVGRSPEWYGEVVGQFVETAGAVVPRLAHRPLGDDRPLLAVPLVGVGLGGARHTKGEVIRAVVARLKRALDNVDADVAIVLRDAEAFSAAQKARADVIPDAWLELDGLDDTVASLIAAARRGRLVPFIGAGVSMGAGAPSWGGLLRALAGRAGVAEQPLSQLDARDAGAVLERRLGADFVPAVVELTTLEHVSLLHQLIASLPVQELVTTNYDRGLEVALEDAGRAVRVLPRQELGDANRWLLKLHGSVDDQDRIVLSRDDYLRFEGAGAALAGIVQALMLTRRMLFVGYSLSDDNFHRLVHQVERAVAGAHREPYATALTPQPLGLMSELWHGRVDVRSTARGGVDDVRRMAILLDRVVAGAAAPAAHLLDDTYDALFTDDERRLRSDLRAVWDHVSDGSEISEDVRIAVRDSLSTIADFAPHAASDRDARAL